MTCNHSAPLLTHFVAISRGSPYTVASALSPRFSRTALPSRMSIAGYILMGVGTAQNYREFVRQRAGSFLDGIVSPRYFRSGRSQETRFRSPLWRERCHPTPVERSRSERNKQSSTRSGLPSNHSRVSDEVGSNPYEAPADWPAA